MLLLLLFGQNLKNDEEVFKNETIGLHTNNFIICHPYLKFTEVNLGYLPWANECRPPAWRQFFPTLSNPGKCKKMQQHQTIKSGGDIYMNIKIKARGQKTC